MKRSFQFHICLFIYWAIYCYIYQKLQVIGFSLAFFLNTEKFQFTTSLLYGIKYQL